MERVVVRSLGVKQEQSLNKPSCCELLSLTWQLIKQAAAMLNFKAAFGFVPAVKGLGGAVVSLKVSSGNA